MPTYVYECAKCGDEFEFWQSIKDDPLKRHTPSCGGKLAKVIQPAGIVLKGAGFYKNDSRGTSKRAATSGAGDAKSGDSSDKSEKSAKSEKKSDSSTSSSNGSSNGSSDSSSSGSSSSKSSEKSTASKSSSD